MNHPDYITEAERKGEQNVLQFIENNIIQWEIKAREQAKLNKAPTRRITMRLRNYTDLMSILSLRFPKEKVEIIIKENKTLNDSFLETKERKP